MSVAYKSKSEKKSKPFQMYFTEAETQLLTEAAQAEGISKGELLRRLFLTHYGALTEPKSYEPSTERNQQPVNLAA